MLQYFYTAGAKCQIIKWHGYLYMDDLMQNTLAVATIILIFCSIKLWDCFVDTQVGTK